MNLDQQALLIGLLASTAIALGGLLAALRMLWNLAKTADQIKDEVLGDAAEGIPSLREFRAFVVHELTYNSGKSLKDQVRRIERRQKKAAAR